MLPGSRVTDWVPPFPAPATARPGRAQHTALLDLAGDQRQPAEHRERLVGCALPGPADAQDGIAARLDLAEGTGGRVDLRGDQLQVATTAQQRTVDSIVDLAQHSQVTLAAQAAQGETTAVKVQRAPRAQGQAAMSAQGQRIAQIQQMSIDLELRRTVLRGQPALDCRPGRGIRVVMVAAGKPHIGRLQVDAGIAGAPWASTSEPVYSCRLRAMRSSRSPSNATTPSLSSERLSKPPALILATSSLPWP